MDIKTKTKSIYNYFEEAKQNIGGETLHLKDGIYITLLCNAVSNMFFAYDKMVKAGDAGYNGANLDVHKKLRSLWEDISNLSRRHDARLEKEMVRLRDVDKRLINKHNVA